MATATAFASPAVIQATFQALGMAILEDGYTYPERVSLARDLVRRYPGYFATVRQSADYGNLTPEGWLAPVTGPLLLVLVPSRATGALSWALGRPLATFTLGELDQAFGFTGGEMGASIVI